MFSLRDAIYNIILASHDEIQIMYLMGDQVSDPWNAIRQIVQVLLVKSFES